MLEMKYYNSYLKEFFEDSNSLVNEKKYNKGDYICIEGNLVNYITIVISGKAEIIPSSLDGNLAMIDVLGPGDFIGDLEYFYHEEYKHSVQAVTEMVVKRISVEKIAGLLSNDKFMKVFTMNFAKKLHKSSLTRKYTTTMNAESRLLQYMIENSIDDVYTLETTFIDVAKVINVSTRHVRRLLGKLEEDNKIKKVNNKKFIIK